jgi:hypothetical protein
MKTHSPPQTGRQQHVSDHTRRCLLTDESGRDQIDQAAADPIHDHIPQSAPRRKARGVLAILDQLEKENANRRFKP